MFFIGEYKVRVSGGIVFMPRKLAARIESGSKYFILQEKDGMIAIYFNEIPAYENDNREFIAEGTLKYIKAIKLPKKIRSQFAGKCTMLGVGNRIELWAEGVDPFGGYTKEQMKEMLENLLLTNNL